ncbi:cytochrome P450 [uncultured Chitinophaga sp.]|jgi:Cytochrome P450|uniref:cytochrome P450 n=1 Tax=uncultured Chitinophaga sp. TaxID=339340 RepID=UPI00263833EF|nr:cytochrome P450 [uncultured Chitinophaga sp.]
MGRLNKLNPFRWQGSGRVYSLPWLKNRLEYSADPERIAAYAKTPFTRSRFVMTMLTQFHLSRNSIVVSEDDHAMWLKRIARPHMPTDEAIPQIARQLMERLFPVPVPGGGEQSFPIADRLIRELYRIMLDNMLQADVLKPLEDFIMRTRFPHGSRPMVLEGLMYSFRLHLPFLRPLRYCVDSLFFKRALYMKRVANKLEQMVFDFAIPRPGSWFATLKELRQSGKITRAQFRGEITSILVSSFSLASALGSALLCLAARPSYRRKIHDDPAFARYFVMEVLRLYPPFRQFGYQQAATDKNGASAGFAHEFMIPVFHLHRNGDVWKDPKKFYPERFLEPDAAKGFKYLPFGMGKRSCPGRNFSMSMITYALRFVCADESRFTLVKRDTLPRGGSGRLVSFAIDDTITYREK